MLYIHLELSALADLMGPYGIRYLGEQLTDLVSSQVKELKVRKYAWYIHYYYVGVNNVIDCKCIIISLISCNTVALSVCKIYFPMTSYYIITTEDNHKQQGAVTQPSHEQRQA